MSRRPYLVVVGFIVAIGLVWTSFTDVGATSFITEIQTTNVVDTSFTVSWVTASAIPGSGVVRYGVDPSNLTSDVSEGPPPPGARGDVHSVLVPSLSPSTAYYYLVMNGSYRDDNSCHLYKVTTGPTSSTTTVTHTMSGQVNQSDGHSAASGVVVSVRILDYSGQNGSAGPVWSGYVSTLTNAQGQWSFNPFSPRTADATAIFNFPNTGDTVLYSVDGGGSGDSGVLSEGLTFDSSSHISIPQITLGPAAPTETPAPNNQATATPGCLPTTTTVTATTTPTVTSTPEAPTAVPTTTTVSVPTVAPAVASPSGSSDAAAASILPVPTPTLIGDGSDQPEAPGPVQQAVATPTPPPQVVEPPTPPPQVVALPTPPRPIAAPPAPTTVPPTAEIEPSPTAVDLVAPVVLRVTPGLRPPVAFSTGTGSVPHQTTSPAAEPTDTVPVPTSTPGGPLTRATNVFLASLGVIVLGLVVAAIGIVAQIRES